MYTDVLHAFGAPTRSIVGFINCTIRKTCHPVVNQDLVYTGYKKYHGMKFQGVVIPNGLIVHLEGPFQAPQNDSGVLNDSGILHNIEKYAIQPGSQEGDPLECRFFQLYSDSAYGVSPYLVSPYASADSLTPAQCEWNTAMGGIRISIEHGFGIIVQEWPFVNAHWKSKILGTPCGLFYWVAVLLSNAHACIEPNQTSVQYSCPPPSLEEYFHT